MMRRFPLFFALSLSLLTGLTGCSDDASSNNATTAPDAGVADSGGPDDSGTPDTGVTDTGADPDADETGCVQAAIDGPWDLTLADDVSIEYSAPIAPEIEGDSRVVSLLFERYSPGPDIGVFDLSEGPDSNFGTCAHCIFVRTDTRERAYYVESGTLETTRDPYRRRPEFAVTGLKLIEVAVDGATRESTPIPGGECIEFADFEGSGVFPPTSWTCNDQNYNDGVQCNCSCGAYDPDCGSTGDCLPGDPSCQEREPLPVVGCEESEVCASEPATGSLECFEPCDWAGRQGCTTGTCIFDTGGLGEDLCISDPLRIAPGLQVGDDCPQTGFQIYCNVNDGFADGYCGANNVCRKLCVSNDECTEPGHTCRSFFLDYPLGYCGPEPVDG